MKNHEQEFHRHKLLSPLYEKREVITIGAYTTKIEFLLANIKKDIQHSGVVIEENCNSQICETETLLWDGRVNAGKIDDMGASRDCIRSQIRVDV